MSKCPTRVKTTLCWSTQVRWDTGMGILVSSIRTALILMMKTRRLLDTSLTTARAILAEFCEPRHVTKQYRVHTACRGAKMSWLYPCQCQCVNSWVRDNFTSVYLGLQSAQGQYFNHTIYSNSTLTLKGTMWHDFGSRCLIKM